MPLSPPHRATTRTVAVWLLVMGTAAGNWSQAAAAGTRSGAIAGAGFTPPDKPYPVEEACDLPYYQPRPDRQPDRHRLDVYRPRGKTGCPVVVFLHGGGWVLGDRAGFFGVPVNRAVGRSLAENGIVAVLPSYRLSPGVRHPEHINDVARAFAWTHANARKYGGRADRIFVAGHSAGGHLAALLATDETYLKAVGRGRKDIRGVMVLSGVYRLDNFPLKFSLGDPFRVLSMRVKVDPLAPVFGSDAEVLRKASPLYHVRPGLPPFLVLYGEFDFGPLKTMAKEFAAALKKNGCEVREKEISWGTHVTVVYSPWSGMDKTTLKALLQFIGRHTGRR